MRHVWPLIALVVTGLLLTVALDTARAKTLIERSNMRGRTVEARWTVVDDTTTTLVYILAAEGADSPHAADVAPLLVVQVSQTENGTGNDLFTAVGEAREFMLKVTGNMSSARLSAALDLQDFESGDTVSSTVNLTFTGVGEVVSFEEKHFTSNEGGVKINVIQDGRGRPASATGTVSGLGINFTPGPSVDAFIQKIHLGWLLVTKE
jgi:hypothetical protein